MNKAKYQYFCTKCGATRDSLLDHPAESGGYSWNCPRCNGPVDSSEVVMTEAPMKIWFDRALELFCYDETSPSCLRYKIDRTPKRHAGDIAGALTGGLKKPNRYWEVVVLGKKIRAHWIVWALHHGEFPQMLDHANGNSQDNRISNLRLADEKTNGMNRRLDSRNSTGVKNVSFIKRFNHYRVSVSVNGKMKNIGAFKTIEEAEAVARQTREENHGEFARHE